MGKFNISLPKSGITGKATSATARAFGKMVTDLEIDIRKLLAKDKLSETDKLRLKRKKEQLRDVKAEMKQESGKAGRQINLARSSKKPVSMPPSLEEAMNKAKGNKNNRGGLQRGGHMDMRKGGMFYK